MPRRPYNKAEVYVDGEFLVANVTVVHDSTKRLLEVRSRDFDKRTFSEVTYVGMSSEGRERVRNYTTAEGDVVVITVGCACGK